MPDDVPPQSKFLRWLVLPFGLSAATSILIWLWLFLRIAIVAMGRGDLLPNPDKIIWPWLPVSTGVYLLIKIVAANYIRLRRKRANGN